MFSEKKFGRALACPDILLFQKNFAGRGGGDGWWGPPPPPPPFRKGLMFIYLKKWIYLFPTFQNTTEIINKNHCFNDFDRGKMALSCKKSYLRCKPYSRWTLLKKLWMVVSLPKNIHIKLYKLYIVLHISCNDENWRSYTSVIPFQFCWHHRFFSKFWYIKKYRYRLSLYRLFQ